MKPVRGIDPAKLTVDEWWELLQQAPDILGPWTRGAAHSVYRASADGVPFVSIVEHEGGYRLESHDEDLSLEIASLVDSGAFQGNLASEDEDSFVYDGLAEAMDGCDEILRERVEVALVEGPDLEALPRVAGPWSPLTSRPEGDPSRVRRRNGAGPFAAKVEETRAGGWAYEVWVGGPHIRALATTREEAMCEADKILFRRGYCDKPANDDEKLVH